MLGGLRDPAPNSGSSPKMPDGTMADSSRLIETHHLVTGRALSFETQPYLQDLVEKIKATADPVVIVAGAGVSMNAGLPSWNVLLDNMGGALGDPVLAEMAQEIEAGNPQRRAETLVQFIKAGNANRRTRELLLDALYENGRVPPPGLLAEALARLVHGLGSQARILTTNFDTILETALSNVLGSPVQSFSLDSVDEWKHLSDHEKQASVLHLHGMVRQNDNPLLPLVLTESQFLRDGARVRTELAEAMKDATVLFMGLSVTDPNLVGPLFESGTGTGDRFALFVPILHHDRYSDTQCATYATRSARYLESKLHLKPVLLKSHSQTIQVVNDLALARAKPDLYRSKGLAKSKSTYYGYRFSTVLDAIDKRLAPAGPAQKQRQTRQDLSEELRRLASEPGGVFSHLRNVAKDHASEVSANEQAAVFLWIREPANSPHWEPPQGGASTGYGIRMRATSAFVHWEEWSGKRLVKIDRASNYVASQAMYSGANVVRNLTPDANSGLWRGCVAVPIIISQARVTDLVANKPLDQLFVGALTLNTNCYVDLGGLASDEKNVSAIAVMDNQHFAKLVDRMVTLVSKLHLTT